LPVPRHENGSPAATFVSTIDWLRAQRAPPQVAQPRRVVYFPDQIDVQGQGRWREEAEKNSESLHGWGAPHGVCR